MARGGTTTGQQWAGSLYDGSSTSYTVIGAVVDDVVAGLFRNPLDSDQGSGLPRVFQLRFSSSSVAEFIAFNTGVTPFTASGGASSLGEKADVLVGRVSGSEVSVWLNGVKGSTAATLTGTPATISTANSVLTVGRFSGGSGQGFGGQIFLALHLPYAVPDAQLAQFRTAEDLVDAVFEPRRIWVPVAAGGGGTVHNVTLTEALTSTDAATSALTAAAAATESIAAAETLAAVMVAVASLTEAASATDAQVAARVQAAAATEAATATDAQAATLTAARSVAEAASATDLAAAVALAVAAVSEAISATDAQSSEPIVTAVLTEAASAADSASVIATLAAALSESAAAADAIAAAAMLVSTLAESVDAADAATTAAQLVALLTESASLADVQSSGTATVHNVSIDELALALDLVVAAIADAIPGTPRYTITARPRRLQLTAAHRRLEINR